VKLTTHRGEASSPEPLEPKLEPEVQTAGAVAPAVSLDENEKEREGEAMADLSDFEVYVTIARAALDCALREREDSTANVRAHMQRLCAERQVRYDPCVAGRAVDDAWHARERAREHFDEQRRSLKPSALQ